MAFCFAQRALDGLHKLSAENELAPQPGLLLIFTEMAVIGITGGISTGKSAFCACLREIVPNAKFFDADQAAHRLVDLDPEVRKEIRREFGNGIFSGTGDLNRDKLRAIVFGDAAKKRALEQILHPRIRRQWRTEAKRHRNSPNF